MTQAEIANYHLALHEKEKRDREQRDRQREADNESIRQRNAAERARQRQERERGRQHEQAKAQYAFLESQIDQVFAQHGLTPEEIAAATTQMIDAGNYNAEAATIESLRIVAERK